MNDTVNPLRPDDAELYLVTLLTPITRRTLREEALTQVDPDLFGDQMYAALWSAARTLRDAEKPISARTLLGHLKGAQEAPASIERAERLLSRYAGHTPDIGEFPHAVSTVIRCGQLRALVEACDHIKLHAMDADDAAQALTLAYDTLATLDRADAATSDVLSYADLLDQFVEQQRNPDTAVVIPTPWTEVNEILNGGLRPGRMYVVGGRPGDGKSISALQIAQHAAAMDYPSLVFSAEMGAGEVTDRLVSSGAVVEQSQITRRLLDRDGWHRVNEYVERARRLPISVVDKPNLTAGYIKSVCRAEKRRNSTAVVVLDYLQLVGSDSRGQQREQEVSAISRAIKQLSRELDVAFVVAAQLNRENVRHNRRPVPADLRESGGIEADADVIILHSRPPIEEGDRKGEPGYTVVMDVAKNRIGRAAWVELDWRAHYATIGSPAQQASVNR